MWTARSPLSSRLSMKSRPCWKSSPVCVLAQGVDERRKHHLEDGLGVGLGQGGEIGWRRLLVLYPEQQGLRGLEQINEFGHSLSFQKKSQKPSAIFIVTISSLL